MLLCNVMELMDRLTEEVSNQPLGQKWQQLYVRLGLMGLEPRKRYSIVAEHKGKKDEEKTRCCILDTIALWRRTESVVGMSEKEMMKQLLNALSQVQGFNAVALQLGQAYSESRLILFVTF